MHHAPRITEHHASRTTHHAPQIMHHTLCTDTSCTDASCTIHHASCTTHHHAPHIIMHGTIILMSSLAPSSLHHPWPIMLASSLTPSCLQALKLTVVSPVGVPKPLSKATPKPLSKANQLQSAKTEAGTKPGTNPVVLKLGAQVPSCFDHHGSIILRSSFAQSSLHHPWTLSSLCHP